MSTPEWLENLVFGSWVYQQGKKMGTCRLRKGDLTDPYSHILYKGPKWLNSHDTITPVIVFYKDGYVLVDWSKLRSCYSRSCYTFTRILGKYCDFIKEKAMPNYRIVRIYRTKTSNKSNMLGSNNEIGDAALQDWFERSLV